LTQLVPEQWQQIKNYANKCHKNQTMGPDALKNVVCGFIQWLLDNEIFIDEAKKEIEDKTGRIVH